jgi:SET domain-containing protein|tara:strand:- start:157 stop:441 length:285 start_codon:yes stop_codon:yes gene_type:complete
MTYKPLPESLTIKPSSINGLGLFATQDIKNGTQLGITHILINDEIFRTPLGGFINHKDNPNCVRITVGNKSFLHTIKDVNQGEELTLKYTIYKV